VNNPDVGLFEMFSPSTLFRRGAPGQGAGRSQHRASWRRSRRERKSYTLPPKNTNKPSLTPTMPLLKSHFLASKSAF